MIEKDLYFINEALRQAEQSHDPINGKKVGSVIVYKNVIVGRGFRNLFIVNERPHIDICFHAEHIALMEAGDNAKGATLYCTMEPCNKRHLGAWNTFEPPESCTQLIMKAGIKRVVYINSDDGEGCGGADLLAKNGIIVNKISIK